MTEPLVGRWCLRPGCERTDKHSHAQESSKIQLIERLRAYAYEISDGMRFEDPRLRERISDLAKAANELERLRKGLANVLAHDRMVSHDIAVAYLNGAAEYSVPGAGVERGSEA